MTVAYRTLIRGTLLQRSALCVGGRSDLDGNADVCFRDGAGRLTIPGTSLAGCLIEAAARIFPTVLRADESSTAFLDVAITGKRTRTCPTGELDSDFLESVWSFSHSHPCKEHVQTEWRQGVGIRQATGAAAAQKRAMYDFEVVPVGTQWDFLLEVNTRRGGSEAEALALLAVQELGKGCAWIGRSPARGTGWFELVESEQIRTKVIRLTSESVDAWPDNTKSDLTLFDELASAGSVSFSEACRDAMAVLAKWKSMPWNYLTLDISFSPGPYLVETLPSEAFDYGYDVLHVGGHPSGALFPDASNLERPFSLPISKAGSGYLWDGKAFDPDDPIVTTQPANLFVHLNPTHSRQPFVPGSGLRGPLRHAASRLARSDRLKTRDPNRVDDPEAKRTADLLSQIIKRETDDVSESSIRHRMSSSMVDSMSASGATTVEYVFDDVTRLFGVEELSSRILVRDAELVGSEWKECKVEHHAEDEFTAGVFGSSKFDRNVLLTGPMRFRIVLEIPPSHPATTPEWDLFRKRVVPALEMARMGFVPIGGGKWRGAGWLKWSINAISLRTAGLSDGEENKDSDSNGIKIAVRKL